MDHRDLLTDGFDRVKEVVEATLDGIEADALTYRPDAEANSIAWLIWHLTRVEDDHIAGVSDNFQIWVADGWDERFGLPFPVEDIGYGQSSDDVDKVRVSAELLLGYHRAVADRTKDYLMIGVAGDSLERIVDENWTPPVTLGARLISVLSDTLQHAGQAAYVRGLYERRQG